MRILHVVNHFDNAGNGTVNVAVDLACESRALGHQVAVASMGGDYEQLMQENGIQHFTLDTSRTFKALARAPIEWRKIIKIFNPDIVHSHVPIASAIAMMGRSYVSLATVHNNFKRSSIVFKLTPNPVGVSRDVAQQFSSSWPRRDSVHVILNGVIGSRRNASPDLPTVEFNSPSVVCVGALSSRKGTDVLLNAMALIYRAGVSADLYLIGNNDGVTYQQLARSLDILPSVHFVGYCSTPEVYLASASVVVQPSRRDPFPLTILEAKHAGRAIVASYVDGIPEALDYGQSGVLVHPGDAEELASAIKALLTNEVARSRLEEASRSSAGLYTTHRMTTEYLDFYGKLIDARKRGLTP